MPRSGRWVPRLARDDHQIALPASGNPLRLGHVYQVHDRRGPYYDSMIGKLIVHQPSGEAIRWFMRGHLDEFVIEGLHTTIPCCAKFLDEGVSRGSHTNFIDARCSGDWPYFRDGNYESGVIDRGGSTARIESVILAWSAPDPQFRRRMRRFLRAAGRQFMKLRGRSKAQETDNHRPGRDHPRASRHQPLQEQGRVGPASSREFQTAGLTRSSPFGGDNSGESAGVCTMKSTSRLGVPPNTIARPSCTVSPSA